MSAQGRKKYGPGFAGKIEDRSYSKEEYAQFSKKQVVRLWEIRNKKDRAAPTEAVVERCAMSFVASVSGNGDNKEGEVAKTPGRWGRNRGNPELEQPERKIPASTKTGKGEKNLK